MPDGRAHRRHVATSPAPTAAPHAHRRIRWDTAQPHGKEGAQSDAMGIGGKAERRRLSGTQADSPVLTVPMRLGWPERRVVRGPQGPPCSSAPTSISPPILPYRDSQPGYMQLCTTNLYFATTPALLLLD